MNGAQVAATCPVISPDWGPTVPGKKKGERAISSGSLLGNGFQTLVSVSLLSNAFTPSLQAIYGGQQVLWDTLGGKGHVARPPFAVLVY